MISLQCKLIDDRGESGCFLFLARHFYAMGSNSKYHSIYAGQKWIRVRSFYVAYRLLFDGGLCEDCKQQKAVEVHHIIPLNDDTIQDEEIVYGMRNLMFLCSACHKKRHKGQAESTE